jgi:hypothetical protein
MVWGSYHAAPTQMLVYAGALTQEVEAPMPDPNPTPDPAGEQDNAERECCIC